MSSPAQHGSPLPAAIADPPPEEHLVRTQIVGSDPVIDVSHLSPLEQTALLTQYARALDRRWPRPILGNTLADEIVTSRPPHQNPRPRG